MWNNPKEKLPKEGEIVACIIQHNKEHKPLSCEIVFGIVEYNNTGENPRVCTEDFTGKGSWSVYLVEPDILDDSYDHYAEYVVAWADYKNLNIPEWIPHDPHWGKYGT